MDDFRNARTAEQIAADRRRRRDIQLVQVQRETDIRNAEVRIQRAIDARQALINRGARPPANEPARPPMRRRPQG